MCLLEMEISLYQSMQHLQTTNHGLKSDGSDGGTYMSNGTLNTYSYGQFLCASSVDLLINWTGVIECDTMTCSVTSIINKRLHVQCSGTGNHITRAFSSI